MKHRKTALRALGLAMATSLALGGCMSLMPMMAPKVEAEKGISAAFPFEPRFVSVEGSRMHYVEIGTGSPVVFVHGNPTSSYLWRNVLPIVGREHRAIALDLIGMGRSDKPDLQYTLDDQIRYFDGFMKALDLHDVTLVLHDWGGPIGIDYAMRHPEQVHAIVLMETFVKPMHWSEADFAMRTMFRRFRDPQEGDELIVKENYFVEKLLPMMAGRDMSEEEMARYREPFRTEADRKPIVRFPREIPIDGEPPGNTRRLALDYELLQRIPVPLLLLRASPGAIVKDEQVAALRAGLPRMEVREVGEGIHFLQETQPTRIGTAILDWSRKP